MVERLASKASFSSQQKYNNNIVIFMIIIFLIQIILPVASANTDVDNLEICMENEGICDDVNGAHDGSSRESWIEGIYNINMKDTETMEFSATWAIYEYARAPLGFSNSVADLLLENDGIFQGDGIPADVIRNSWNEPWDGEQGSILVKDKLMGEINSSVENILSSLGSASSPSTTWANEVENNGVIVNCEIDGAQDDNGNAYTPPICIQTTVEIGLSADKFGLNTNSNLNLESAYKSLLVMGGQVKTELPVNAESGHKSTYYIDPPPYATIIGTNGPTAEKIPVSGDFPYYSGKWQINNLNSASTYSSNLEFMMGFRNNETTNTFNLESNSKSMDLEVVLDLSNENAATIDLVATINHIETGSIDGLELIPTDKGNIPVVTSDGIRMAHHNGLIDLDSISNKFPVSTVGNSLSETVPGLSVQMGDFEWILDSSLDNSGLLPGGLNYQHTLADCEEVGVNYCTSGDAAMSNNYPVYLRSTSQPFQLALSDLIGDKLGDLSFLSGVTQDDLEQIVNSGMSFETILDPSFLSSMKPTGMGSTEINLKLILPTWASNSEGGNIITLFHKTDNNYIGNFGLQGSNSFDWSHALCYDGLSSCSDVSADVFCTSEEKSCKRSSIELDISEYSFSELQKGISIEFELNMEVAIHRIEVPNSILDSMKSDSTDVSIPVLPADLLKLILEIADRGESPYSTTFSICDNDQIDICREEQVIEFSTAGITEFTNNFGESITSLIKSELQTEPSMGEINIDGFQINTTLEGLIDDDGIIGDRNGIVLSISIPKVRTTVGLGNSWSEIFDIVNGDGLDNLNIDINAPMIENIVTPIMTPMITAMDGLTNAITMVAASTIIDGLVLDGIQTPIPSSNSFDMPVDLTLTLPLGIKLEELSSLNTITSMEFNSEGRQVIKYRMLSDSSDTLNFNLVIGWQWILQQLLPYIVILLLFITWRVRARMKKRSKRRRAAEIKIIEEEASENKFTRPLVFIPNIEVVSISNCNISIKKRSSS
jgi:hypothetical protein